MRTPPWKLVIYALLIFVGLAAAVPNLIPAATTAGWPAWLAGNRITLGLDLRGGSHLVLEVDSAALTVERLQILADELRDALRRDGVSGVVVSARTDLVDVVLDAQEQRGAVAETIATLAPAGAGPFTGSGIAIEDAGPRALALRFTESALAGMVDAAIEQSLEVVRQRIDEIGVAEPTVQRIGADRIMVQLPGVQDPARLKALLGSTAKMSFHLVAADGSQPGVRLLPLRDGDGRVPVELRPIVAGDHLVDAAVGFDADTRAPIVSFRFDTAGARAFAEATSTHVGSALAIVLDGVVISAPVIREPIVGGAGQISGRFTVEDAGDLAALLRAGALPAPLHVIEERTVGADLGGDVIEMGLWTGIAGFGLVVLFMVLLYGPWGLIANLALALNVGLTFGALSLLGATLTLPGIAGIVLGIGLAVDANVLINERIREETRKGLRPRAALDAGFRRAYAVIVDSNLTTLIATALLFNIGAGPVRGFAVTMGIGILISMFTAVAVVRIAMEWVVRRRGARPLRIEPWLRLVPDGTRFRFMRGRFLGIGVSALLSIASVWLFVAPGLNYGVDFRGGIQVAVATEGPADLAGLRSGLEGLGLGEVTLQQYGADDRVLVRVEQQVGGEQAQQTAIAAIKAAVTGQAPGAAFEQVEVIGPKVSGELSQAGILAAALAGLAMFGYIWVRFEWHFAVGAIATLVLDVTKMVGFFALTGIDFNLTAIAALLTLIGYSVNDKVVVYDRMRENLRLYKQMSLRDLIDLSINQTLGRSLFTSATAFLAMLPMALFGGSAVESFAVPMLFGIVVAASSSVFIAAPILLFLGDWRARRRAAAAALAADEAPAQSPGDAGAAHG